MTAWHLDPTVLAAYAAGTALTPAQEASVEAHLLGCARCRAAVARPVDSARLDRVLTEVLDRFDAPAPGPAERTLLALGVRDDTAKLLAATPSLRAPWLLSVTLVLLLALATAHQVDRGVVLFLALAPALPVLGVAVAFAPAVDPVSELAAAAPYSRVRLLAVRATAVVAVTALVAAALALLLPGAPWLAAASLLPALALTASTLALSTWFEPVRVAALLSAGWVVVGLRGVLPGRDPLLVARPTVQLACAVLLVVALGVVAVRRDDRGLSGGVA